MAKSVAPSSTPVDVMIGWLGTREIPGPKANPTIAGKPTSWFALVGHGEIKSDEVANCAVAVGASEVIAALLAAGLTLDDVQAEADAAEAEGRPAKGALRMLIDRGINVVLPPLDQRMLARSYCTWGLDTSRDPKRGDVGVIPRGAKWQGHVMRIVSINRKTGVAKCIGANQSDTTSYAEHHLSEFIAIRRSVPATVKDLRKAGSTTVSRGDAQQATGGALVVGSVAAGVAETVAHQSVQQATDAALNLPAMGDQVTVVHTLISSGVAIGNLFVENPWIIICLGAGVGVWWLGRSGNLNRLAQHIAGVPISSQTA